MRERERLARAQRELEALARRAPAYEQLFPRAAELVRRVVPFDGGCWHTLDPATLLITSHWTNLSGAGFPLILDAEYRRPDVAKFADLAGRALPAVATATQAVPATGRFGGYRERGWGSELRASFDVDGTTWGSVMLLRADDMPPFGEREARALAALGRTIASALRAGLARAAAARRSPGGPGLVLLDARDQLEHATAPAVAALQGLERGELPPAVVAAAAAARGAPARARARLRSRDGAWLVVQASQLDDAGRVAVVVEPARPSQVAPLLAAAYGLTSREREVLRDVLHGRSTKEIAAALGVSPYTAEDHLRSLFEKTGTRSRGELVARLFFEHFEPRLGDPLAADGGFA